MVKMKGGWLSVTTKSACGNGFILNALGLSANRVASGTALLNVGLQTNKFLSILKLCVGLLN